MHADRSLNTLKSFGCGPEALGGGCCKYSMHLEGREHTRHCQKAKHIVLCRSHFLRQITKKATPVHKVAQATCGTLRFTHHSQVCAYSARVACRPAGLLWSAATNTCTQTSAFTLSSPFFCTQNNVDHGSTHTQQENVTNTQSGTLSVLND
jgi:hypothetical protein